MPAATFACNSRRRSCTEAIPPAAKLPQRRGRGAIRSQISSNEWQASALQKEQDCAARGDGNRQPKEKTAIAHYVDTQNGQMAEDGTEHHGQGHAGTDPGRGRN